MPLASRRRSASGGKASSGGFSAWHARQSGRAYPVRGWTLGSASAWQSTHSIPFCPWVEAT